MCQHELIGRRLAGVEVRVPLRIWQYAGGRSELSGHEPEGDRSMRAVCQRVSRAWVSVDGEVVGQIGVGWMVLLGVGPNDDAATADRMADKVVGLRVFEDEAGRMNRSVGDVGGSVLLVSQFTLYADTSRGRRPGFTGAAPPAVAEPLVERVAALIRERGLSVATGRFGALMDVELVNHGPVTIVLTDEPAP
jgi:D-tyrosyl-tRNA(Tyr) deacylase